MVNNYLSSFLDGIYRDRYWYPVALSIFILLTVGVSQAMNGYHDWTGALSNGLVLMSGWMIGSGLVGLIKGE